MKAGFKDFRYANTNQTMIWYIEFNLYSFEILNFIYTVISPLEFNKPKFESIITFLESPPPTDTKDEDQERVIDDDLFRSIM